MLGIDHGAAPTHDEAQPRPCCGGKERALARTAHTHHHWPVASLAWWLLGFEAQPAQRKAAGYRTQTTSRTTHQRTFRKCTHHANPQHHPLPCRPAESRSPQRSGAATNTAELGGRVMGDRTGKQAKKQQTCATHLIDRSRSWSIETRMIRSIVSKKKQRTYSGPVETCGNRVSGGCKMVRCCIFTV